MSNPGDLVEVLEKFQTNFWREKHHWFTAYEFEKDTATIYTIPYLSGTYRLIQFTNSFSDNGLNARDAMTFCPHSLLFFSATKPFGNLVISREDVSQNTLFNPIKFELIWLDYLQFVLEILGKTR